MFGKITSQTNLLLALLLMCANSCVSSSDAANVFRIGKMIPSGGSDYYRWGLHLQASSSTEDLPIPTSCKESATYLESLVPREVFEITWTAYTVTAREVGRGGGWQDEDFAAFHANWSSSVEKQYPGEGGFYWDVRDLLLKEWGRKGQISDGAICDPMNIAVSKELPNRYDALMISIAKKGRSLN